MVPSAPHLRGALDDERSNDQRVVSWFERVSLADIS
jgi:hypothetical protein